MDFVTASLNVCAMSRKIFFVVVEQTFCESLRQKQFSTKSHRLYVVALFPLPWEFYCNPRRKEGDFGLPPKNVNLRGEVLIFIPLAMEALGGKYHMI